MLRLISHACGCAFFEMKQQLEALNRFGDDNNCSCNHQRSLNKKQFKSS
jgi:hypothetical protein